MNTYRSLYTLTGPFGDPSYTELMDKVAAFERAEEEGLLYLIENRRHFQYKHLAHEESPWGRRFRTPSGTFPMWAYMRVSWGHIRKERPLSLGAFIKNANRALDRSYPPRSLESSLHDVYGGRLLESFHKGERYNLVSVIPGPSGPTVLDRGEELTQKGLKDLLSQARSLGVPWVELDGETLEKAKWATSEGLRWSEMLLGPASGSGWSFLIDVDSGALIPTFGYSLGG